MVQRGNIYKALRIGLTHRRCWLKLFKYKVNNRVIQLLLSEVLCAPLPSLGVAEVLDTGCGRRQGMDS